MQLGAGVGAVGDDVAYQGEVVPGGVDVPVDGPGGSDAPTATVAPSDGDAPIEIAAPSASTAPQADSAIAAPFDKVKAFWALDAAARRATRCRRKAEPLGTAKVFVRFEPSGKVRAARVGEPPYAATPTGACIENEMRSVTVAPFAGEDVTLGVRVTLH